MIKKDDFITKKTINLLIDLGYSGSDKIEVRGASEWLESKYPSSVLRKGYHLFREDLVHKAFLKYPKNSHDSIYDKGIESEPKLYYTRREYIIKLVIKEIVEKLKTNELKKYENKN